MISTVMSVKRPLLHQGALRLRVGGEVRAALLDRTYRYDTRREKVPVSTLKPLTT
jgi:hypothetical protein